MAKPTYFRDFPNLDYAISANKAGQANFINIKDYFHLLKVRDDIFRKDTLYVPYTIKNGERPEQISYDHYQDEQFYWVILQINNITNFYSEWPLSEPELTEYIYNKYGSVSAAEQIHHWETYETFDQSTPPKRVLPDGLIVDKNYIFYYRAEPDSNVVLSTKPISVSNFEHERVLNERKSQIYILDPKYIYDYQREVRNYARRLTPGASRVTISDYD